MGGKCSVHRGNMKCIQPFASKTRRDHFGNAGVDGKIILILILEKHAVTVLCWIRTKRTGKDLLLELNNRVSHAISLMRNALRR
jgi:hypothetical protein